MARPTRRGFMAGAAALIVSTALTRPTFGAGGGVGEHIPDLNDEIYKITPSGVPFEVQQWDAKFFQEYLRYGVPKHWRENG